MQPGVLELIRVTKPYKLASREMHEDDAYVRIPLTPAPLPKGARGKEVVIGPGTFTIIAGPCSVENEEMILRTAEFLREQGVALMRAGKLKPAAVPIPSRDSAGKASIFSPASGRRPASALSRS